MWQGSSVCPVQKGSNSESIHLWRQGGRGVRVVTRTVTIYEVRQAG